MPDSAIGQDGAWPPKYRDAYLFGDFIFGKIFSLTPKAGGGHNRTLFMRVPRPRPISMTFCSSPGAQTLQYTTFNNGGQVHRIVPSSG